MIPSLKTLLNSPAYLFAAGLILLCVALQYAGLDHLLHFQRDAIASGNWWLLLSGNFVHLGSSHLWMNLAGFALVVALVWQHYSAIEWALLVVFSSVVVGLGLWFLDPEVFAYVGFSGTLHGLILAGVLADFRVYPKSACLLLVLVVGKLIWEQMAGALPGSEAVAGGRVVVNAHLYGAIGGALLGSMILLVRRSRHKPDATPATTPGTAPGTVPDTAPDTET